MSSGRKMSACCTAANRGGVGRKNGIERAKPGPKRRRWKMNPLPEPNRPENTGGQNPSADASPASATAGSTADKSSTGSSDPKKPPRAGALVTSLIFSAVAIAFAFFVIPYLDRMHGPAPDQYAKAENFTDKLWS